MTFTPHSLPPLVPTPTVWPSSMRIYWVDTNGHFCTTPEPIGTVWPHNNNPWPSLGKEAEPPQTLDALLKHTFGIGTRNDTELPPKRGGAATIPTATMVDLMTKAYLPYIQLCCSGEAPIAVELVPGVYAAHGCIEQTSSLALRHGNTHFSEGFKALPRTQDGALPLIWSRAAIANALGCANVLAKPTY